MSLSRSKRVTKRINYLATANGNSDDDDFCEYTPPSKKIKEPKKKESKEKCESNSKISVKCMSKERNPKQRFSLEEKEFQRELEMAIELSAADSGDFQGFNKEKKEKSEDLEFFSPLRDTVVTVEIHSLPKEKTENEEKHQVNSEIFEVKDQKNMYVLPPEKKPSPPGDFAEKRPRKKVNFAEDNSDSWSEDEIKTATPESDMSDYFPSPTKLKKKRESKKLKNSKKKESSIAKTKRVPVKKTLNKQISYAMTTESSTDDRHECDGTETIMLPLPLRNSLKDNQVAVDNETTVELARDNRKETYESESETEENTAPVKSIKVSKSKTELKAPSPSKPLKCKTNSTNAKDNLPLKISNSFDIKSHGPPNLIFKSPVISASSVCQSSLKTPPRIGLRLGLSRKVSAKPLHPNASVK